MTDDVVSVTACEIGWFVFIVDLISSTVKLMQVVVCVSVCAQTTECSVNYLCVYIYRFGFVLLVELVCCLHELIPLLLSVLKPLQSFIQTSIISYVGSLQLTVLAMPKVPIMRVYRRDEQERPVSPALTTVQLLHQVWIQTFAWRFLCKALPTGVRAG